MYIDSHCHINFPELAIQEPDILQNMRDHQVSHALCVGVNFEDWEQVLGMAMRHPHIYASVGVHPDYEQVEEPTSLQIEERGSHPRVVAIGETGLDYYRLSGDMSWQQERFRRHIRAARTLHKPLIIHTRSAAEDMLRILREERASEVGGVMHCFTETYEVAQAAIDLGFYISFSGIVSFKNAKELKKVVQQVSLEHTLIETDSPYLAPVPYRGKTNQPAYVSYVAAEIASLKGVSPEQVGETTSNNFFRLFSTAKPA